MPGGSREVGAKGGRTAIENSGAFRVTVRKEQKKKFEKGKKKKEKESLKKKKEIRNKKAATEAGTTLSPVFDVLKKRKKEEQLAPLNFGQVITRLLSQSSYGQSQI